MNISEPDYVARRMGQRLVPCTPKQWAFIKSLCEQVIEICPEDEATVARTILDNPVSKGSASPIIDTLKGYIAKARTAAKAQKAQAVDAEAPEGIHFESDTVFKVQVAVHGSGKKYAKALVPATGEWQYMGRAPLSRLSEATLMTLEQAKEFGHLYGMCCVCGRTLTNEGSIEAGIGPVCASKF